MYYVERTIALFVIQLGTFSTNIKGTLAKTFGFSATDISKMDADYVYMAWVVKCLNAIEAYTTSYVAYQHLVRYGEKDVTVIVEPVFPTFDPPPPIVMAGIQHRFVTSVNLIKANPACTEDIEKYLGINSTITVAAKGGDTPELKVKLDAGFASVSFHKYSNGGLNLYRDKGDGKGYGTVPYKTLFYSPFVDKDIPAIGQSSTLKYKGIFLDHDVETGNFSPEVSITIAGR